MTSSYHPGTEMVPVEALRCGDPITDIDGCYKVLEARPVDGGGVVLELESKHNNKFHVVERSFPAGYTVGRSPRPCF
jgi:hypothetical protein